MENKSNCKLLCWILAYLSWIALNCLVGYLAYLVYSKGISGELIIFIITGVIGLDMGIVYGTLKKFGIKAKIPTGGKKKEGKDVI